MGQKREYRYLPDGGSLPADFDELYAALSSKMLEKYEEKVQKKEAKKPSAITPEALVSTSVEPITPPLLCVIQTMLAGVLWKSSKICPRYLRHQPRGR
jgi:hypothetical protein